MDHQYASKVASIIGAPLPINAAATILQELNKAYAQGMANGAAQEREAFPDLSAVISWLENGCDPREAAKELRHYAAAIKAKG